jgi:hypothetical protein
MTATVMPLSAQVLTVPASSLRGGGFPALLVGSYADDPTVILMTFSSVAQAQSWLSQTPNFTATQGPF